MPEKNAYDFLRRLPMQKMPPPAIIPLKAKAVILDDPKLKYVELLEPYKPNVEYKAIRKKGHKFAVRLPVEDPGNPELGAAIVRDLEDNQQYSITYPHFLALFDQVKLSPPVVLPLKVQASYIESRLEPYDASNKKHKKNGAWDRGHEFTVQPPVEDPGDPKLAATIVTDVTDNEQYAVTYPHFIKLFGKQSIKTGDTMTYDEIAAQLVERGDPELANRVKLAGLAASIREAGHDDLADALVASGEGAAEVLVSKICECIRAEAIAQEGGDYGRCFKLFRIDGSELDLTDTVAVGDTIIEWQSTDDDSFNAYSYAWHVRSQSGTSNCLGNTQGHTVKISKIAPRFAETLAAVGGGEGAPFQTPDVLDKRNNDLLLMLLDRNLGLKVDDVGYLVRQWEGPNHSNARVQIRAKPDKSTGTPMFSVSLAVNLSIEADGALDPIRASVDALDDIMRKL